VIWNQGDYKTQKYLVMYLTIVSLSKCW